MTWVAEYVAPGSTGFGSHFVAWPQAAAWLREMARRTAPVNGGPLLLSVAKAAPNTEFTGEIEGHRYTLRQEFVAVVEAGAP